MAELIEKGALLADFNNGGIHIEFDLPVEEILGEDVDIDDFSMLVQDAIQAYRKMVIGTIQNQPTTTEAEIRAKAKRELAEQIEKRIKEEVALLESEREEAREYDDEQVIFAVSNQLRAFAYSLRVVAEQLKEE